MILKNIASMRTLVKKVNSLTIRLPYGINKVTKIFFVSFLSKISQFVATTYGGHMTRSQEIDYYDLTRSFIKKLRGDQLTQRELSEKLGFSFNKVGKWESGATQLKWADFFSVAEALGVSIEDKFEAVFGHTRVEMTPYGIIKFLENSFALDSVNQESIARLQKKWKSEDASPDFAEVLMVFDLRPSMMMGFLTQFVDCSEVEELTAEYEIFLQQQNVLHENPVAGFVLEGLQLKDYKNLAEHDDELLARHSGCSVEELKKTLRNLLALKVITYDDRKYNTTGIDFSYSSLATPKMRRFNKYTLEFLAKKYPIEGTRPVPGTYVNVGSSSHRVVALSRSASEKVEKLIAKFHNEVGEVVKLDDEEKDNVQVITVASISSSVELEKI